MVGNEETREKVKKMIVEDRIDLDHQPISVWVEGGGGNRGKRRNKKKVKRKIIWTEEGK